MKNRKIILGLFGLAILAVHAGAAFAEIAGRAQFVNGEVRLTDIAGQVHTLRKGDAVNEGDTIDSAKDASAQIRMQDGGFIAVRSDTKLKFDSFKFKGKEDGTENSFFSLFKGGFRAVTGLIGRVNKQNYRITTPAATIGIRGTDHESFYAPANLPGALAGAYSKVNIGETSLATDVGTINVKPNQMGYAGGINQLPKLQPINTNIFTVAPAPAKEVKKEDKQDKEGKGGEQKQVAQKEQKAAAAENGKATDGGDTATGTSGGQAEVRSTAVVDNTSTAAGANVGATPVTGTGAATNPAVVAPPPATQNLTPVTLVDPATNITLNATNQTLTSGNGQTTSLQNGVFDVQAQAAATAAVTAAAATATAAGAAVLNLPVPLTPATVAIGNPATPGPATAAMLAVSNAAANVAAANAITLTSTISSATANANAAQILANTAVGKASAAQTAFTANGVFADSTAITANDLINAPTTGAAAQMQSANAVVQTAKSTVVTQNTALTAAQAAAAAALGTPTTPNTVQGDLAAANALLAVATTQNGIITTNQAALSAAGVTGITTLQAAVTAAQAAATAAQNAATSAASLQAAGDFTGAQAAMLTAQAELAKALAAQAIVNAALAANTAVTSSVNLANGLASGVSTNPVNIVSTQLTAAQTAASNAVAALAVTATGGATPSAADSVQTQAGIVAANAPIAAYNNPAVNTALGGNGGFGHWGLAINPAPKEELVAMGSAQPQTTYVLDGNKNLVEIRHSVIDGNGYNYFNPAPPISDADVMLSGGVAKDTFRFVDNSGYMGRWQGGNIVVTDLAANPVPTQTIALGATSAHWGIYLNPSPNYVQSLVATANYTLVAATHPTDSFGNVGTLNSAYINANFGAQKVDTGVNLSFNTANAVNISAKNMVFVANATGVPISGSGFDVSPAGIGSLVFTCTGANCDVAGYQGDIVGQFVGADAIHAALGYTIHAVVTSPIANQPHTDLIQGLAAFSTATAPTVAPIVPPTINTLTEILTSYYDMPGGGTFGVSDNKHTDNYTALPGGYTLSGGNLVSVTGQLQNNGNVSSETISGGTPSGPTTVNGITYGYYAGKNVAGTGTAATLTGTDFQGVPFTNTLLGTYHWIKVPDASPFYLSMALPVVSATYTAVAGVATNQNNAFGAVNLATTSLTVDFTRQAVSLNLDATLGTYSWNASATDIRLDGSGGFRANSGTSSPHQNLTVTLTNGATPSVGFGDISGNLGGIGLNGAGLVYTLAGYDPLTPFGHQHLNGSVVFSGTQQSATTPYVIGLVAAGMTPAGATDSSYNHWVNGGINDFSRVTLNVNGIPTGIDGDALVTVPANGACTPTPCPAYVTQTPARFSMPTVVESGSDPLTGISWGRYAGTITVTDRIASAPLGNIDATVQNVHGIFSGQQSAPTVLPVSGNFAYTLAGHTSPTDNAGNVGTLTSATLTAHFTAQTVDAAVSLNIPATTQTWVASATGVPILQGAYFEARKEVGGATTPPLSVTMNGSALNTTGRLVGGFTGTTGQGVGVAYSLNVNGNAGTTVSGVAAFHR